jgi:unsaturated chondroitin disaccharide hydrolase
MMKDYLKQAVEKMTRTAHEIKGGIPYLARDREYDDYSSRPSWWTNGFYPGILWLLYQYTQDERFKQYALLVESKLDTVLDEFNDVDHDAGFIWKLSSVCHYEFTGNKRSRIQGLKAASFLASRYHPQGEYIRAWNGDWARGHAIIDSLMNLSILYWASRELKDEGFYQIAKKTADTAIREFIREDGSLYHIVVFDESTGKRNGQRLGQGYSENSSWGRGTSWALYGMTISYRETRDLRYLEAARKVAAFVMKHLPADYVPYADYLAPDEERRKKDSSAGAITACGFIQLHQLTQEEIYLDMAKKMIKGLHDTCLAPDDDQALLIHGNVAYHAKELHETDISIIYGDYYYLEALMMINGFKGYF